MQLGGIGSNISVDEVAAQLWRYGYSTYRYTPEQKELINFIESCPEPIIYIECVRGFRKSSGILNYLAEKAIREKLEILAISKQQDQVADIIRQQFEVIFKDCPDDIKPRPTQSRRRYLFPTKNSCFLFDGVDKLGGENKRGYGFNYVFPDEVGSWSNGCYQIIKQVIYPAVSRKRQETGFGKIIVATTPSLSSEHDSYKLRDECISKGAYFRRDIDETPSIYTPAYKREVIDLYGGEDSALYQTEFKLRRATNKSRAVIPEFSRDQHVIKSHKIPTYCSKYVTVDWGINRDFTHCLFAYHDFDRAKIVYQKEVVFKEFTLIDDIWESIWTEQRKLWGDEKPVLRVADQDARLLGELKNKHGVYFTSAKKDDRKEVDINRFRKLFRDNQIEILEDGCPVFIAQCEGGIWTEDRSDYERLTTVNERGEKVSTIGHLDGIDAGRYLQRLMDWNKNPYPIIAPSSLEIAMHGQHRDRRSINKFIRGRDNEQ